MGIGQITPRRTASRIGRLQIAIIVLAVITAVLHLFLGITITMAGGMAGGSGPTGSWLLQVLPMLFILNFLGYIILLVALYVPQLKLFQHSIRWVLIVFTAVTISAYFVIDGLTPNSIGYGDKLIEVALILLLLVENRKAARLARG